MKSTLISLVFGIALCAPTSTSGVELVSDGGFEATDPVFFTNPFWKTTSTNFGSPLCSEVLCGTGAQPAGSGTNNGDYWAWFGGATSTELGTVMQQPIQFPVGTAELTFAIFNTITDSPQDYIEFQIDGQAVWSYNGANVGTEYTPVTVNIDAYADGGMHNLAIVSETFNANGGVTNFWIDDVSIDAIAIPEPSASLIALLTACGLTMLRRL